MSFTLKEKLREEGYVSAKEAAEILGVSRPTLYRYAQDGRIVQHFPISWLPGMYKRSELETFWRDVVETTNHGPNQRVAK